MNNRGVQASRLRDLAHEWRAELARKIALFMGSAEKQVTDRSCDGPPAPLPAP
jgi:hypothetical protein